MCLWMCSIYCAAEVKVLGSQGSSRKALLLNLQRKARRHQDKARHRVLQQLYTLNVIVLHCHSSSRSMLFQSQPPLECQLH